MKYPCRNSRVATRTIEGEAVIVSPDDAVLHNLNEVGSFIWNLADGTASIRTIAEQLCHNFDVSIEEAVEDVQVFCGVLVERNILNLSDTPHTDGMDD